MLCDRCNLFVGAPCDVCRTLSRITFLLSTGRIQQEDESVILATLRQSAGVISDLVERGPRDKFGVDRTKSTESGAEEQPKEENKEEEVVDSSVVAEPKDKKEKKDKSKKSKKEKKPKKEENALEEAVKAEVDKTLEEDEKKKAEKGLATGSGVKPVLTQAEVQQNPEKFGLQNWPASGDKSNNPASSRPVFSGRKPREPEGPPPRRHDDELIRRRPEANPKKRKRGTKGAGHRDRGRQFQRASWRYFSQSRDQWRPKRR